MANLLSLDNYVPETDSYVSDIIPGTNAYTITYIGDSYYPSLFGMRFYESMLAKGMCTVSFVKKNGENRTMTVTRKLSLIEHILGEPAAFANSDHNTYHPTVIRCFDVSEKKWKSFDIDSVILFSTYHRAF